jgi:hypothetical protein
MQTLAAFEFIHTHPCKVRMFYPCPSLKFALVSQFYTQKLRDSQKLISGRVEGIKF